MAIQLDVKKVLSNLTCPIGLDPLINAVNLSPCCHKVNQVAAEKYYGKIVNGSCEFKKNCILCNTPVVTYAIDHTIRNLANCLFGHEKDLETLPTHPLVLEEKKNEVDLPYPGIQAVFIHKIGDWNTTFNNRLDDICRIMRFDSTTDDSLLENFGLLGYWNGKITLAITFKKSSSFNEYLLAHRIVGVENTSSLSHYVACTPKEIKTVFRIVALNNEIPTERFNQVREIVERGSCDPIPKPPKAPGNILTIKRML